MTTYFDLDTLISECGLTDIENEIVFAMMDGYTIPDIMEDRGYSSRFAVHQRFDNAVEKIVRRNTERWEEWTEKQHRYHIRQHLKHHVPHHVQQDSMRKAA